MAGVGIVEERAKDLKSSASFSNSSRATLACPDIPSSAYSLSRMRRSKAGWTFEDLERLYVGLGFEIREGGKHRLYVHPRFPQLRATVTRSRSLAKGYIEHALNLAERLFEMEAKNEK